MILKEIHIESFRNMKNIILPFGNKVTFIAGTNGTSKTSLLGLIAQPFVFSKQKVGNDHRTIFGKQFHTEFSEIHHLTKYDDIESMKYKIVLGELFENKELPVKGYRRKGEGERKEGLRFVVGETRTAGEGNYPLPVLYLGLKRLYPLGEHKEKDVSIEPKTTISAKESATYNEYHKKILLMMNQEFSLENVRTPNKELIGGNNGEYDSCGFSAGQDNIGQVLTAILSFGRLQDAMGDEYKGGLLLIDEIESTLHPLAQEKLIESLYKFARDYKLQIIVTTHSLDILKLGMQEKYQYDTEIIYLSTSRGPVKYLQKISFQEIEEDMTALPFRKKPDVFILCEDDEAASFLANILPIEIKQKVTIVPLKLGASELEAMATSNLVKVNKIIFVLDGDKKKYIKKRVLVLPGGASPEAAIYEYISKIPEADSLWKKYPKKMYFRDNPGKPKNRDEYKKFFGKIKAVDGKSWNKFFKRWAKEHKKEVNIFISEFKNCLTKLC